MANSLNHINNDFLHRSAVLLKTLLVETHMHINLQIYAQISVTMHVNENDRRSRRVFFCFYSATFKLTSAKFQTFAYNQGWQCGTVRSEFAYYVPRTLNRTVPAYRTSIQLLKRIPYQRTAPVPLQKT